MLNLLISFLSYVFSLNFKKKSREWCSLIFYVLLLLVGRQEGQLAYDYTFGDVD